MAVTRREFLGALSAATTTVALSACGGKNRKSSPSTPAATDTPVDTGDFSALAFDMKAWHYDACHNVWWQTGVTYCTKPATATYEKLGIYVPGAYLKPVDEKVDLSKLDAPKTVECVRTPDKHVGGYTCETAPIVMPVNTPDFAAQNAPIAYLYDGLEPYMNAGFVYVYAGCRGRSSGYDSLSPNEGFFSGGAPWGITDLKAAIRYLRYNAQVLPGAMDCITPFGHAAGGLLAALVGSTGNSELYDEYLAHIGAATHDAEGTTIGDEVSACACWCPEPPAEYADAAYEWELGQFDNSDSRAEGTWTKLVSHDLAASYASYVDALALYDGTTQLTLNETDGGISTDGSYYTYLMKVLEDAASQFLSSTAFPHALDQTDTASGFFPGSGQKSVPSATPSMPALTTDPSVATMPAATDSTSTHGAATALAPSGTMVVPTTQPATKSPTYASRHDYIAALNVTSPWLTYSETTKTAHIANLASFVVDCRKPSGPVCAFDMADRSSVVNQLFGNDEGSLHFSQQVSDTLSAHSSTYDNVSGWDGSLPGAWSGDLSKTDSLTVAMKRRRDMYDPLYFLSRASEGFQTSSVAAHWRINVGVAQTSVPLSASMNLALALKSYSGVHDVSYTPVWGVGRTLAERNEADATDSFISWIKTQFSPQASPTDTAAQTAAVTDSAPATGDMPQTTSDYQ